MLFIPRIGNAYSVALNGTVLATGGHLQTHGEAWSAKQPVSIGFPQDLLRDQNELTIQLRGDAGRRAGLVPIMLGPSRLVEPHYTRAYAFRVLLPGVAATFSALVSAFCLLLWLQQREKLYAWACIGEAVWALVVLDITMEWMPLRWHAWTALAVLFARRVGLGALHHHRAGVRCAAGARACRRSRVAMGGTVLRTRPCADRLIDTGETIAFAAVVALCGHLGAPDARSAQERLDGARAVVGRSHGAAGGRSSRRRRIANRFERFRRACLGEVRRHAARAHDHVGREQALPPGARRSIAPAGVARSARRAEGTRAARIVRARFAARACARGDGGARAHPARHARRRRRESGDCDAPARKRRRAGGGSRGDAARIARPSQAVDRCDEPAERRRQCAAGEPALSTAATHRAGGTHDRLAGRRAAALGAGHRPGDAAPAIPAAGSDLERTAARASLDADA